MFTSFKANLVVYLNVVCMKFGDNVSIFAGYHFLEAWMTFKIKGATTAIRYILIFRCVGPLFGRTIPYKELCLLNKIFKTNQFITVKKKMTKISWLLMKILCK